MKVSIGYKPIRGPWGGGNSFVINLCEALQNAGHTVVFDLNSLDIDIILIIDPRKRPAIISFGVGELFRYLLLRNKNAIVVHRINECDERKNTLFTNFRLRTANYVADYSVFVGTWLKYLSVWRPQDKRGNSVILNGADPNIFFAGSKPMWKIGQKLRLVTHHWGGNWMKGFDIYEKLDQMLSSSNWRNKIDFTYIGNAPDGFRFRNASHIQPLKAVALAEELRQHDVYLTASINEPGGNHQNEGALCGLPILYRNSGCLPEYCDGFGIGFNGPEDFEISLKKISENYPAIYAKMKDYPNRSSFSTNQYLMLFDELIRRKPELKSKRALMRNPFLALVTQFLF